MGLWNCPAHGLVGPMACCAQATFVTTPENIEPPTLVTTIIRSRPDLSIMRQTAEKHFDNYNFGHLRVEDHDGWESQQDDHHTRMTKKIYFENDTPGEPTFTGVLAAEFDGTGKLTHLSLEGIDGFESPSDIS